MTVYRERGTPVSLAFFMLVVTALCWLFSFSMMYLATVPAVALWWAKLSYLGIPLIAPSAYHFAVTALQIGARRRWLVRIVWLLGVGFVLTAIGTNELVAGVHEYWWGYYTQLGAASVAFLAYFVIVLLGSLLEYALAYRKLEPGTHRHRIRGLMIASAIGYLGIYDFFPTFGIPLYPVGYLAVCVFLLLIARTIWHYRLVDLTPSFAADQIIATMADPLVVCDERGTIKVVNAAACATFGYTEVEVARRAPSCVCAKRNPNKRRCCALVCASLSSAIWKSSYAGVTGPLYRSASLFRISSQMERHPLAPW